MKLQEDKKIRLNLKFKGNRTYLQGPDIFSALVTFIPVTGSVYFQMNRLIDRQIEIVKLPSSKIQLQDLSGVFKYWDNDNAIEIGILESKEEITERYNYDEEAVISGATILDKEGTLPSSSEFSFIERVVALNKAMLQQSITENSVKWYFTTLELKYVPNDGVSIRLSLVRQLGIRLILSSIEVDGFPIGTLGFTGVKLT